MKSLNIVRAVSRREFLKTLSCTSLLTVIPCSTVIAAQKPVQELLSLNSGDTLQLNSYVGLLLP